MPYRRSALMQDRLADKRTRIMRATRQLIARGGFRAAQIAAVASAAGLSTGSIYRYFPSQAQLFIEVLTAAVAQYNSTYGGKTGPDGATNPYAYVPSNFQFGAPTISQDFRLTKVFTFKERYKFSLFGEVFNAFNIANLTYTSFSLGTSSAPNDPPAYNPYGQPSGRTQNIFGSGGPRSFQIGARFNF